MMPGLPDCYNSSTITKYIQNIVYTEFKKTKGVSTIDYIFFKKIHGIKPVLIIIFNRYIYIYTHRYISVKSFEKYFFPILKERNVY